ncbi:MAG: RnfABCDGE type electron transport complex subunit D [Nitrospirota bacterium]
MEEKELIVSPWPHIKSDVTIPKLMYGVIIALLPAALVSIYFFGISALQVILVCIIVSIVTEGVFQKIIGEDITINDGSAALTGLLLGMNLPPGAPWWLSLVGSVIAIAIGKHVYGGLGHNPFNPAIVARVFLLISFPLQMTTWQRPHPILSGVDVTTGATPLGDLQTARMMNTGLGDAARFNIIDGLWGNMGGSLGEVSAAALLIGALYLLYKRYITWHIPLSMIGTVVVFSGIFWLIDPSKYANPLFHLFTGGLMIGAFYMATDMVTSPITIKGQLIFGVGCGLLTIIIRMWGGYPEGVSFAILLMNAVTPLIDKNIISTRYGEKAVE